MVQIEAARGKIYRGGPFRAVTMQARMARLLDE